MDSTLEILDECTCLNDVCKVLFNKANYTNREKVKKILSEHNVDWVKWLAEKKRKPELHCIVCGKVLKGDQKKFCSHTCSAKHNNKLRTKKRFCKKCGKELDSTQRNFCSHKCQVDYSYEKYIERWKNGQEDGLSGEYGISQRIRRYLFEKNNCSCEICGWNEKNEYTNTIPLEVHHIDGDYRNNKEENLQLLCPNHHSLTETTKSHNKNGRKGRKKYDTR